MSHAAFLETNNAAIAAFKDGAADRASTYLDAAAAVEKDAKVDDARLIACDAARSALARTLSELNLAILRKVPTQQNEDTFGAEVQANVAGEVAKYASAVRGCGEKNDANICKYSAYLSAVAGLNGSKKDRPDDFPADLDARQAKALELTYAASLVDTYRYMAQATIHVADLLKKNGDLIEKPKRSYGGYM
eukprot:Rhum_TRINITY_DN22872_c0_g1::Rhum_TRINITY_DN22872_c0_g1_i1::g.176089::m.176089